MHTSMILDTWLCCMCVWCIYPWCGKFCHGRTDGRTNGQGDSRSRIRSLTLMYDAYILDPDTRGHDAHIYDAWCVHLYMILIHACIFGLRSLTLIHVCVMHTSIIRDPDTCVYDACIHDAAYLSCMYKPRLWCIYTLCMYVLCIYICSLIIMHMCLMH